MATQALDIDDRSMSVGRIFERAFGVMGAEPLTVFGITFLFAALPQLVMNYVLRSSLAGIQPSDFGRIFAIASIPWALLLIATMVVQGALVQATVAYSEGRNAGFGPSCVAGLRMALPMIGLVIVTMIPVGLGSLMLLVPGIMLYTMWSVATPALVAERCGVFGALGRSRYLTKGARWKIFGINLMILIVIWLISFGVLLLFTGTGLAPIGQQLSAPLMMFNAVSSTLLTAFWSTMQSSLFVELRNWKDGAAPDQLAEVFA